MRLLRSPLLTWVILLSLGACASSGGLRTDVALIELRTYHCPDADGRRETLGFIRQALMPAIKRHDPTPVGLFVPQDSNRHEVYLLLGYKNTKSLLERNTRLQQDRRFVNAASDFALPGQPRPYTRIESRLLRPFRGLPGLVPPPQDSPSRLVELRVYESANEALARRKVEMFNRGEIELMQEVGLGPVFFGESLAAADMPNLVYMLSAPTKQDHAAHWKEFGTDPRWAAMRDLPRYAKTVSKITSVILLPDPGSDI